VPAGGKLAAMPDALLLLEGRDGERAELIVHRVRLIDRVAARFHARALDRELAAGTPAASHALLTLRAKRLLDARERRRTARRLRQLIRLARRRWSIQARVTLARDPVRDAAGALERLARRLEDPTPAAVRGLALAQLLLNDGNAPLYAARASAAVDSAANAVLDALEPGTPTFHESELRTDPRQEGQMGMLQRLLRQRASKATTCPRCGVPAPLGADDCEKCGWDLREAYDAPTAADERVPPDR
jgi:ribosomal protein L40E